MNDCLVISGKPRKNIVKTIEKDLDLNGLSLDMIYD
jgi:hypothetical protein